MHGLINKRIYLGQGHLTNVNTSSFVKSINEEGSPNISLKIYKEKRILKDRYFIFRRSLLEKLSVFLRNHNLWMMEISDTGGMEKMKYTDPKTIVPPKNLDELIEELHKVFDSDHVNVEYVTELMASYKSNPKDWKKFAIFDLHR